MPVLSKGSFQWTGAGTYIANVVSDFDYFEMYNMGSSAGSVWNNSTANPGVVKSAKFFKGMPLGTALAMKNTNGAGTDTSFFIATGGFTPFASNAPPVFPQVAVTGITAANPAAVTTGAAHGLVQGDTVTFVGLNGTMSSLNGLKFSVDFITDATHFDITLDTSSAGAGQIGNVPATAGFVQKVIPTYFQPKNILIGPSTTSGSVAADGLSLLLNLNESPALQYPGIFPGAAGSVPYQVGAYLRVNVPTNLGSNTGNNSLATMNQVIGKITAVSTQAGYSLPNELTLQLQGGVTAAGLAAFNYPVGVANFKSSFPFVSDIAEIPTIFTEAEDNVGIRGMIFGPSLFAAATTNPSTVFWMAYKCDQAS